MSLVIRNYKYRLYPTKNQANKLSLWLELQRQLYNTLLEQKSGLYKTRKQSISAYEQNRQLTELRNDPEFSEYQELGSKSLQAISFRLDKAFKGFFRRCKSGQTPGYPRFKGRNRISSIEFPSTDRWLLIEGSKKHNTLVLKGLGHIKLKGSNPGNIESFKGMSIKYSPVLDRWYCTICVRLNRDRNCLNKNKEIAIDLGCKDMISMNDGTKISNPKFYKNNEKFLNKLKSKRDLSKKGSKSRKQLSKQCAKLSEHIGNSRKDYLHKLSHFMIQNYGVIVTEKLDVQNMISKDNDSSLNKANLDAGWSKLIFMLKYKAEEAGTKFIEIDTKKVKPSQRCPECWSIDKKSLTQRVHNCKICGFKGDRDTVSAMVMMKEYTKNRLAANLLIEIKTSLSPQH
jgi:putative transposase